MIRPSANGHAFEYADGTPFFLLGDTWWPTFTYRFRWREDDTLVPLGPEAGLKEFVAYRRKQEFNCVAILAAMPNWANDDKPSTLKMTDGTVLRSGWGQAGTKSTKNMTDEAGNRAFLFPGKVPGYEKYFPDVDRINPAYFQSMDKKIDYLNSQGFVPFIEVARRDIGQAWKKYYSWPDSYSPLHTVYLELAVRQICVCIVRSTSTRQKTQFRLTIGMPRPTGSSMSMELRRSALLPAQIRQAHRCGIGGTRTRPDGSAFIRSATFAPTTAMPCWKKSSRPIRPFPPSMASRITTAWKISKADRTMQRCFAARPCMAAFCPAV